jgi:hypothetical protein
MCLQSKGGASVTLEPGGQFELSGAPLDDLHATAEETRRHLEEARRAELSDDAHCFKNPTRTATHTATDVCKSASQVLKSTVLPTESRRLTWAAERCMGNCLMTSASLILHKRQKPIVQAGRGQGADCKPS